MSEITWVFDLDQGDWRYYAGTHRAIVWERPDGWWVKVGRDVDKQIIIDEGGFRGDNGKKKAQEFAEQMIAKDKQDSPPV